MKMLLAVCLASSDFLQVLFDAPLGDAAASADNTVVLRDGIGLVGKSLELVNQHSGLAIAGGSWGQACYQRATRRSGSRKSQVGQRPA